MEAFCIGDLHLDGPIAKFVDKHELFIIGELDKVAEAARVKGVRNLFLLGDLSHGPRMSYDSQIALLDWVTRNKDMNIYAILGNHDMFSEDPNAGHSMQLLGRMSLPNFKLIEKPTVLKIDGAKVNFLPWPHRNFKKMLNVAHVGCYGAKSDSGKIFEEEGLTTSKRLALIGHLHTKQRVRNSYYPGNLYQTTFGEQEKKYYAHVQYTDDDYTIRFVPHKPAIILRTIHIETKKDLASIPKDKSVLVRIVVADGANVNPNQFSKYSNVVKIRPYKTKDELNSVLVEDLQEGLDIKIRTKDFLEAYMQTQNIEPDMHQKTMRLWKTIVRSNKQ